MLLLIAGTRKWKDISVQGRAISAVRGYIDTLARDIDLVNGDAYGVDKWARYWAEKRGHRVSLVIPDWDRFPGRAGLIRDKHMVDQVVAVVTFWDGESGGTAFTMNYARKHQKLLATFIITHKGIERRDEPSYAGPINICTMS